MRPVENIDEADASLSPADGRGTEGLSFLRLLTLLINRRARVAAWSVIGALVAGAVVAVRPAQYASTASFVPQGGGTPRSGLASLAGEFGISLPASSSSLSPELYLKIAGSPGLLREVVVDSVVVSEQGGRRVSILDLLEVEGETRELRIERGIDRLKRGLRMTSAKATGVVEITATSPWPSVSAGIASAIIAQINTFNVNVSKSQARAERDFVQLQLDSAETELVTAENRLATFLRTTRQAGGSPELRITRDRLERDVASKERVLVGLTEALQQTSLQAARDIPAITMLETPVPAARPLPSMRVKTVILGALLGAFLGSLAIIVSSIINHRRASGDTEVTELLDALRPWRRDLLAR